MTKQTEALKLALEGAANYIDALGGDSRKYRQALATQPAQQEPGRNHWEDGDVFERIAAMKTQPAQRTWVGLSDEEYAKLAEEFGPFPINEIEAKLKEKNT